MSFVFSARLGKTAQISIKRELSKKLCDHADHGQVGIPAVWNTSERGEHHFVDEREATIPIGQDRPMALFCDGVKPQSRFIARRIVHRLEAERMGFLCSARDCIASAMKSCSSQRQPSSHGMPGEFFSLQGKLTTLGSGMFVGSSAFSVNTGYHGLTWLTPRLA